MLPATLAITNNEYVAVKQTKNNDDFVYRNSNYLLSCKYQMTSEHCLALQSEITNVWKRQQYQIQLFPLPSSRMVHLGSCKARRKTPGLAGQEDQSQETAYSSPLTPSISSPHHT